MKTLWQNLKKSYSAFEKERLQVMAYSQTIRQESKKLIHKILHNDRANNTRTLQKIKTNVDALLRLIERNPYLYQVGFLNEGLEEYAEVVFLEAYLKDNFEIALYLPKAIPHEAFIGGIADASGELVRFVRNQMQVKEAENVHRYITTLYEHFLDLEVSRNNKLRQKIGEVRSNLLRLEEIIFSLKLKG
jgi:predicted translin family RNA/ssDNA-binding protein